MKILSQFLSILMLLEISTRTCKLSIPLNIRPCPSVTPELTLVLVGFVELKLQFSVQCCVLCVCLSFHFLDHGLVSLPTQRFLSAPLISSYPFLHALCCKTLRLALAMTSKYVLGTKIATSCNDVFAQRIYFLIFTFLNIKNEIIHGSRNLFLF